MNDIVYIDHMKIADVPASPRYANEQSTHHFWLCEGYIIVSNIMHVERKTQQFHPYNKRNKRFGKHLKNEATKNIQQPG